MIDLARYNYFNILTWAVKAFQSPDSGTVCPHNNISHVVTDYVTLIRQFFSISIRQSLFPGNIRNAYMHTCS